VRSARGVPAVDDLDLGAVDADFLLHARPLLNAVGITWITMYLSGRTAAMTSSSMPRSSGRPGATPRWLLLVVAAVSSAVAITCRACARPMRCLRLA